MLMSFSERNARNSRAASFCCSSETERLLFINVIVVIGSLIP